MGVEAEGTGDLDNGLNLELVLDGGVEELGDGTKRDNRIF
jgi:hypothetical protein